ncbi:MAG: ABC transporter permease [Polyangiaceae bacterium]|nr:ABC transporter permease [Polyangiaceae bacterium]
MSAVGQTPAANQASVAQRIESTIGEIGAATLDLLRAMRDMYSVFVQTLYYTVRGKREPGAVVQQMYEIGNKSVFFVTVVMGFIGLIGIYQTGTQAARVLPDYSLMGATYLQLLLREIAPSVGAMIIATRVGAGIAAEIGSMVVTEQVDALRMCAADPIDFLIKPRFIASVVMTTALIIWICTVMFFAGGVTAWSFFGVPFRTFFDLSVVQTGDVVICLTKCLAYGAAIPVVSGYCGLTTFGGSEGVGWATTRAVVNSSLAVVFLDFLISVGGYIIFFS